MGLREADCWPGGEAVGLDIGVLADPFAVGGLILAQPRTPVRAALTSSCLNALKRTAYEGESVMLRLVFGGGLPQSPAASRAGASRGSSLKRILVASAVAGAVSACAKEPAPVPMAQPLMPIVQQKARVAGKVYYRVEIEDDGLEAQHPPMRRKTSEPDDPTEPFSPNYGRKKASAAAHKIASVNDSDH